ncbi:16S rRNA (guanine(527)-N(7))-methyltransferase RsmG [Tsuneonella deserti]|uniref:16S rRNA (guanine(527)-N(7))-methyltransferase RsmG n=1 Tax=Tsuneonella deserti TaxID=2035528 RepID=UPI0016638596|nr:16S rRNA (guanine(527)-N(7))-methyltransferase RsmG [Tsuneonella deserti]
MITTEEEARDFVSARCSRAALTRLERFVEMLIAENSRQNLVARATLDQIWQRHIADSVQLLDHVPRETGIWLDLGTGAGFPGVVVGLVRESQDLIIVESRRKRVEWLECVVSELELKHCRVEGRRVEDVEAFSADVISARAFAPLEKLLKLARRFSTNDTVWLLPKGRSAEQELSDFSERERHMFHVEQSQTDPESGIIVGRFAGDSSG